MKLLQIFKALKHYLKPDRGKIVLAIILILIGSLLNVSYGYLNGAAVDAITKLDYKMFFVFFIIYLLVQVIGTQGLRKPSRLILSKVSLNLTQKMSYDAFKKTNQLPVKAFEEKTTGEFIKRITNDTETISVVLTQLISIVVDLFAVIIVTFYIFYNSWIVGLEIGIYIVIVYFVTKHYMPKIRTHEKEIKKQDDNCTSEINQAIIGIRETRALGIRNIIDHNMKDLINSIFTKRKNQITFQTKYSMIISTINSILEVGVFITCGILIYYKMSTITFFIAMTWYVYRYMNVVNMFSELSTSYQRVVVALERIEEIVNNKLYQDQQYGDKHVDSVDGNITFEHVTFGYEEETSQLKDFSIDIKSNQKVAIVGKSGQGKTTLFNLLLRYFNPQLGRILIDNIPIEEFDEESLRKHVSIIRQEPFLFHKTILENFLIVNPDLTLDQIRELCKKANIDEYIMSLKDQYDTLIGEGGVNLSGGQKQRLAIARTLIKNSKIILFDEATSALDNNSQNYIKKTIDDLSKDHTIIMIAHRLSTIIDADTIYIVENGQVSGKGNHQQLMNENELYQQLYLGE